MSFHRSKCQFECVSSFFSPLTLPGIPSPCSFCVESPTTSITWGFSLLLDKTLQATLCFPRHTWSPYWNDKKTQLELEVMHELHRQLHAKLMHAELRPKYTRLLLQDILLWPNVLGTLCHFSICAEYDPANQIILFLLWSRYIESSGLVLMTV